MNLNLESYLLDIELNPNVDRGATKFVYSMIANAIADALSISRVGLWFIDEFDKTMIRCHHLENRSDFEETAFELREFEFPLYFQTLYQQRVINASDAVKNIATQSLSEQYLIPRGIVSMLDVPIFSKGKFVGIICCEHVGEQREWLSDEIIFVSYLAVIISKTLLAQQTNKAIDKLNQSNFELSEVKENLYDQLKESEKLANLGRLVAGMAHEVNNPLSIAITGFSAMDEQIQDLKKCFDKEELTEEHFQEFMLQMSDYTQLVTRNLQRAASLVRDFKQVASDQATDEQYEFDLLDNLNTLIHSLRPLTKKVPVDIVIHAEQHSEIKLHSYPGIFNQIFSNLIMNSVKHGFDNEFLVQEPSISINVNIVDSELQLEYRDNGIGIPDSIINQIFDEYFTTKRGVGGTGLGLSIVKELVEQKLQGKIEVEKDLHLGVRFLITLPYEQY